MKRLVMTAVMAFATSTTVFAGNFEAMVAEVNSDSIIVRAIDKPLKVVSDTRENMAKGNKVLVEFKGEIPAIQATSIQTLDLMPKIPPVIDDPQKYGLWID